MSFDVKGYFSKLKYFLWENLQQFLSYITTEQLAVELAIVNIDYIYIIKRIPAG